MKTKLNPMLTLAVCGLAFLFLPVQAFAQEAAPAAADPISPEAQNFILQLLTGLTVKYPIIATLVGLMGTMRLWAKPVFSIVHQVIALTPSQWDDGLWASGYDFLTVNPIGKALAWLLDWVASIKLTPPGAAPRTPPPAAS